MKFCENCGQKLLKNDKFCSNCGKDINEIVVTKQKSEGLGTASMVLGIISLILSFIINIVVFPLAFAGLIMGIINKAQKGKKISGIILNALSMFIAVMIFLAWIFIITFGLFAYLDDKVQTFDEEINTEEVFGVWNCKGFNNINNDSYELTISLTNENTFTIFKYDDLKNYVEGTYEFDSKDVNKFIKSHIYSLDLSGKKEFENGEFKREIDKDYQMVITKTKKDFHAVFNVDDIDKPYYCTK